MTTAVLSNGTASQVTLTSMEMVDFINGERQAAGGKTLRHDQFMVKVPKVLGDAAPKFLGTGTYANGTGGTLERPVYRFPKREACLMAMSYSYDLQAKVFDRMTALEAATAQPTNAAALLTDPGAMRFLLLGYTEKVIELEEVVAELMPKVVAFDRLATESDGSVSLRMAAKLVQMPEKQFLQLANSAGFIFRHHHSNRWLGYADKIRAGLVEQKLTTVERDDGSTKVVEQALITRAGLAKLAAAAQRAAVTH